MAAKRKPNSTGSKTPAVGDKSTPREVRRRAPAVLRGGNAVSPGVAVGRAYCIRDIFIGDESRPLDDAAALRELDRYDAARERTAADLKAV